MHNAAFYPKLAWGNLRRNKSTYLPYLLACVVSILALYTLVAINNNGALDNLPHAAVVASFTGFGAIVLTIFSAILLFYTNSFLIKRRKRELGLYSILGMTKGDIGLVMLFESLFIDAVALVGGLGGGILLGKLVFAALMRLVRFPIDVEMPVSGRAIGITAAIFGVIFLLTLLTNLRGVRKANPLQLLAGAKEGEREPRASWLLTLLGLLTLGGGYAIAIIVQNPIDALMYFFLAAFLVIVGTFCLFTSGSIALLKLLRRNKGYYYTPGHFISVSGMIYRMKQNAAGLASICILSCMVLFTVSFTLSLQVGGEDSLRNNYPHDYRLVFSAPDAGDDVLADVQTMARKKGAEITGMRDVRSFYTMAQAGAESGSYTSVSNFGGGNNAGITLLPLEDYNRAEGSDLFLAEGEALLYCNSGRYDGATLTLNGTEYSLTQLDELGGRPAGGKDIAPGYTLVLPSLQAVQQAAEACARRLGTAEVEAVPLQRIVQFDLAGSEEAKTAFGASLSVYAQDAPTPFDYRSLEEQRVAWYSLTGGFLFLGLYLGIVFLLAAAMIIYYKQLSEGYDDHDRYEILQKVGMSHEEVRANISGQIRAVFFLPLVVAMVHVAVAFLPASRLLLVFGITNPWMLALALGITILAYAAIYLFVYRRTAGTYFRLVRRAAATG